MKGSNVNFEEEGGGGGGVESESILNISTTFYFIIKLVKSR